MNHTVVANCIINSIKSFLLHSQLVFAKCINYKKCNLAIGLNQQDIFLKKLFITQVLKVCGMPGPTACLKLLQKVCLKRWRKEKKSMTGPRQPQPAAIRLMLECLQGSARWSGC